MPEFEDQDCFSSSIKAEQTLIRYNVLVNVDTVIYWKVIDPKSAILEVEAGGTSTVIVSSSAVQGMSFGGLAGITALAEVEKGKTD